MANQGGVIASQPKMRHAVRRHDGIHVRDAYAPAGIFARADTDSSTSSTATKFPVAAVAGGVAAGAAIVVVAIVIWQWWGRRIDNKARHGRHKTSSSGSGSHTRNTSSQNIQMSRPSVQSSRSSYTVKASSLNGSSDDHSTADRDYKGSLGGADEYAIPIVGRGGQPPLPSQILLPSSNYLQSPPPSHQPPKAAPVAPAHVERPSPSSARSYAPARPSPLAQAARVASPLPPPEYPYLPARHPEAHDRLSGYSESVTSLGPDGQVGMAV